MCIRDSVMDGKGVKMSKSQWNAVAPGEITKKYGADIYVYGRQV